MDLNKIILKPCPFCGNKAKLIVNIQSFQPYAMVECESCSAKTERVMQSVDYCATDEAAKLWNRRVPSNHNEEEQ